MREYGPDRKRESMTINKLAVTTDVLTDRGGLNLLVKYITSIGVLPLLLGSFGKLRKNGKGASIESIMTQLICFFFDGTHSAVSWFDRLKQDEGYAAIIETRHEDMVSSHQVKRFFRGFTMVCGRAFRTILNQLFVWRLHLEQPTVLVLMLDSMVMENDDAVKREGVKPTYKKKKGFQPLHLIWNGKIISALFRGGSTHGNHGKGAITMLVEMITLVRRRYSQTVPIIVRMDSGFLDIKILSELDRLGVGFIVSGKMYDHIADFIEASASPWNAYDNGHQRWDYQEFGSRCGAWKQFYRAFYTRLHQESRQLVFEFVRPDNVILTNLGVHAGLTQQLVKAGHADMMNTHEIISSHHLRGADELPHRALKEFASKHLPFRRFSMNTAWYYLMVIAFFLFECFKEDHLVGLVEIGAYPKTVRRMVIDIAAKIVRTGGYVYMKVTRSVMDRLNFDLLWNDCQSPPLTIIRV